MILDGRSELYNLRDDIGEENNLVEKEPGIAAKLKGMLHAWRARCEAKRPEVNPNWESFDRFGCIRD